MMQKRIYLGIFNRSNQLVDVQAVPAWQFKSIKRGAIISRKDYRKFMQNNPAKSNVVKAA